MSSKNQLPISQHATDQTEGGSCLQKELPQLPFEETSKMAGHKGLMSVPGTSWLSHPMEASHLCGLTLSRAPKENIVLYSKRVKRWSTLSEMSDHGLGTWV